MVRKKVQSKHSDPCIHATIKPCPPSFALSTTMYNEPATSTQEDLSFDHVRNYSLVQDQFMSFGMSRTCEVDTCGNDVLGGSGAYNHNYSSSLRQVSIRSVSTRAYKITHIYGPKSPPSTPFHTDWDGYGREHSIGQVSIDFASIL